MIGGRSSCAFCNSKHVSKAIGVCVECLRRKGEKVLDHLLRRHSSLRRRLNLPPRPPRAEDGLLCTLCSNRCRIPEGGAGFCGLRRNAEGRLVPSHRIGYLHAYHDALPTNCCAAWFCPESLNLGYYNLAVFFYGCNFNCLFCQNSSHKLELAKPPSVKREEFIASVERGESVRCVCYFGGSPEPQLPFAINASREILEKRRVRICWEWNGCGNKSLVKLATELSLQSRGIVKFDLKASNPVLSVALSGVENSQAFENFELIAAKYFEGSDPPVLTATTLLVPYYVDAVEVGKIASFIASLSENIPYSLLIFHPDFFMRDLPITPRSQVSSCLRAAKRHLRRVHLGNQHLLAFAPP